MLALRIALRYLFSRKGHNAVNIISLMAMAGVAVAVAAMVCVMSVFNGFSDIATARLSALDPALELRPADGRLTFNADSLLPLVEATEGVAAAAPILREQGLARMAGRQADVALWGVDSRWRHATGVDSVIIDGQLLIDTVVPFGAAAVATAIDLGIRPSAGAIATEVWVADRLARVNPAMPLSSFRADTIAVSAVWETDQAELDHGVIAMPIDRLRRLTGRPAGAASAIAVAAAPGADIKALKKNLGEIEGVEAATRLEQHPLAYRMIRIEKWITFMMLAFILAIASFNIVSTLSMLILEKRESTFIMQAMGAGKRLIDGIYVMEGWLVSLCGTAIGTMIGIALSLIQQHYGLIRLAGDPTRLSIQAYPARLSPADLPLVIATAAITGLLTGLLTLIIRKR